MADFLIVYGAVALLLTIGLGGGWLVHKLVTSVLTRWQDRKEPEAVAAALKTLADAGILFLDRTLEEAMRDKYGLPGKHTQPPGTDRPEPTPTPAALPPAPERTDLLRLWDGSFDLVGYLPSDARDGEEGVVFLDRSVVATVGVVGAHCTGQPVWLTVDSGRGRWTGRLKGVTYDNDPLSRLRAKFEPEPSWLGGPMDGWTR